MLTSLKKYLLLVFLCLLSATYALYGEKGKMITIERDAEAETTLKDFIIPLFKAAGLNPKNLQFFIVANPEINAAAGAGSHIFLNTGFILAAKSAAQVVGVLAHETGHIAGGHSARFEESMKNQTLAMAAVMVLGLTGGLATSNPDLAMAGLMGSFHLGERAGLHYSRTQERAADQAGAKYLQQLGWPIAGALDFMRMLERQESLKEPSNPYLRTHPLWEERIRAMEALGQNKSTIHLPPDFEPRFQRIKAKLYAYTYSLKETLKIYKGTTFVDRYAQAHAHHLSGNLSHALQLTQKLLEEEPNNPFLWELKGAILGDLGSREAAQQAYRKSIQLLPQNGLLRISLARLLLDQERPSLLNEALQHLIEAKKTESLNTLLWLGASCIYILLYLHLVFPDK